MLVNSSIRKSLLSLLFLVMSNSLVFPLNSQSNFSIECLPGGAVTLPSTLSIHQKGFSDINILAQYRHDNFLLPIYYSVRMGFSIIENLKVEIEINHLKIILQNKPTEIEEFSVTHGYNQIWINAAGNYHGVIIRSGIGGVIAHPENTIRGEKYDESLGLFNQGYHLCGITSQLAAQRKFYMSKHFFLSFEVKLNAAYAKIPVAYGFAHTPIYAIHALFGTGITF